MKDIYSPLEIDEQWDQRAPAGEDGAGTAVLERPDTTVEETNSDTAGAYTFVPDQDGNGGVTSDSGSPDQAVATTVDMSTAEASGDDVNTMATEPEKQAVAAGGGMTPTPPEGSNDNTGNLQENKLDKDDDDDAIANLVGAKDNSDKDSDGQHPAGVSAESAELNEPHIDSQHTDSTPVESAQTTTEKVIEPTSETEDSLAPEVRTSAEMGSSDSSEVEHSAVNEAATSVAVENTIKELAEVNRNIESQIAELEKSKEQKEAAKKEAEAQVEAYKTDIEGLEGDISTLKAIAESNKKQIDLHSKAEV